MRGLPEVPGPVRELVKRLENAGFETWTVGGEVRDSLLGMSSGRNEWDLATRATPKQMRKLFDRTVPLGVEYGTMGVFASDGELYEITTFRHDVITYGRKAVVAFASTLDEDLARRDFTINAIAWHPRRKVLHDPHGGRRDLEDRVLRAVGDPAQRFREDYLRVLRGLRFAGALKFEIHPDTWAGMREAVPGLAGLSMERVREELLKVMDAARPSRALALYETSGARAVILPQLSEGIGPGALATIDAVPQEGAHTRIAALLACGFGENANRGAVTELLRGLRFSNAETDRIAVAVGGGLGPERRLVDDAVARRRWLSSLGRRSAGDVFQLWTAALDAGTAPVADNDVRHVIAAVQRDLDRRVPMSVNELAVAGRDLVALGWTPGPRVGRTLQRLLEAVWGDPSLNDRATLLEIAAEEPPSS